MICDAATGASCRTFSPSSDTFVRTLALCVGAGGADVTGSTYMRSTGKQFGCLELLSISKTVSWWVHLVQLLQIYQYSEKTTQKKKY